MSCEMSKSACLLEKPTEGRGKGGGKGKGKGSSPGKTGGTQAGSTPELYSFAEAQWKRSMEAQLTASQAECKRLKASFVLREGETEPEPCTEGELPCEDELHDLELFIRNNKEAAKTSLFCKIASDAAAEKAGRLREKLKAAKPAESLHRAVLGKIQKAKHKRDKFLERLLTLRQSLAATQQEIGEVTAAKATNELELASLEIEFTRTAAATVPQAPRIHPPVLSEAELASQPELKAFQESQAFKDWQCALLAAQEAEAASYRAAQEAATPKWKDEHKEHEAATPAPDGTSTAVPASDDMELEQLDHADMDALFKLSGDRKAFDDFITVQGVGKKARKQL